MTTTIWLIAAFALGYLTAGFRHHYWFCRGFAAGRRFAESHRPATDLPPELFAALSQQQEGPT